MSNFIKYVTFCVFCIFSTSSFAAEKVALVIGNSQYQHISSLQNPQNDAVAVAQRLKSLGFKVLRPVQKNRDAQLDLSLADFIRAKTVFQQQAKGAELALLYYAGHGATLGRNRDAHLLPVDVREPQDQAGLELLQQQSYNLNNLLADVSGKAQLTVAVFDACREIPEVSAVTRSLGGGSTRGLERLRQVGQRQIVAYSGAAGQLVDDGAGQKNSPYTSQLLAVLDAAPDQEVGDFFRDVAAKVSSRIGQQPEVVIQGVPPRRYYLAAKQPVIEEPRIASVKPKPPEQQPPTPLARQDFEPEMVFIQGGTFTMGSPVNEEDRDDDERQHQVTVGDFYMGKYEVTFAEWDRCVAEKGCKHRPKDEGWGRGTRPVINVSWHDAQEYVRWLNRKTGKQYRLSTEAEWEYAARAGSKTAYPWGNNISCSQADYWQDNGSCHGRGTSAVGRFAANRWGLHDTVGNVYEWTCSAYDKNYGGAEQRCVSDSASEDRSLRGGSWSNDPRDVRSANRVWFNPTNRNDYVGFRLSRTP